MTAKTPEYLHVVERVNEPMTRRYKDATHGNECKRFLRFVIENDLRAEGKHKHIHRR